MRINDPLDVLLTVFIYSWIVLTPILLGLGVLKLVELVR